MSRDDDEPEYVHIVGIKLPGDPRLHDMKAAGFDWVTTACGLDGRGYAAGVIDVVIGPDTDLPPLAACEECDEIKVAALEKRARRARDRLTLARAATPNAIR